MNYLFIFQLRDPVLLLYSSFTMLIVKVWHCTVEHSIQYNTKMAGDVVVSGDGGYFGGGGAAVGVVVVVTEVVMVK